ncbi:hypothetical protein OSK85_24735, partial [Escherichia coli]|nr:hypothetical protein [Escherichia coli]
KELASQEDSSFLLSTYMLYLSVARYTCAYLSSLCLSEFFCLHQRLSDLLLWLYYLCEVISLYFLLSSHCFAIWNPSMGTQNR